MKGINGEQQLWLPPELELDVITRFPTWELGSGLLPSYRTLFAINSWVISLLLCFSKLDLYWTCKQTNEQNLDKLLTFKYAYIPFFNNHKYDIELIISLSAGQRLHGEGKSLLSYQMYFGIWKSTVCTVTSCKSVTCKNKNKTVKGNLYFTSIMLATPSRHKEHFGSKVPTRIASPVWRRRGKKYTGTLAFMIDRVKKTVAVASFSSHPPPNNYRGRSSKNLIKSCLWTHRKEREKEDLLKQPSDEQLPFPLVTGV